MSTIEDGAGHYTADTPVTLLRHYLATLSFRLRVALADAPEDFGSYRACEGAMNPAEIVRHMTHTLKYVHAEFVSGADTESPGALDLAGEVDRFRGMLRTVDRDIASPQQIAESRLLMMLQGPLTDAMTHVGQISMLRRIAGCPVEKTNYMKARVAID